MAALTTGSGDRARVATHEAGHVIAALVVGARVRFASIAPDDRIFRAALQDRPTAPRPRVKRRPRRPRRRTIGGVAHGPARSPIGAALIAAGGIAAETIAFGGYRAESADQDVEQIRGLAEETGDGLSPDGTVRLYLGHALGRLRERWGAVEAIRDALLQEENIDEARIEDIVRPHGFGGGSRARGRMAAWAPDDPEPVALFTYPRPTAARVVRVGNDLFLPGGRFGLGISA